MFFIGYTLSLICDRIVLDPKIKQEDNVIHPSDTIIQIIDGKLENKTETEKEKEKELENTGRDINTLNHSERILNFEIPHNNFHALRKGSNSSKDVKKGESGSPEKTCDYFAKRKTISIIKSRISPEKKQEKQEQIFKNIFSKTERLASFAENQFIPAFIGELHQHIESSVPNNHQIFCEIFDEARKSYSQDFNNREKIPICNQKHLTSFLLLSTLYIHSFLFGISLGLLEDLHEIVYTISILTFYKLVESIALGISLGKSNIEREIFIILTLIFALTKPIGMLIGVVLDDFQILRGIFLALIGGTTLYVSTSEAIIEELSISQFKYQKYIGFMCGVVLNATVISIGLVH